ncbi:hypothetical protein GINT2_002301 [Glugoides intestinalis]
MLRLNYTKDDDDLKFILYCYEKNAIFTKADTLLLIDTSNASHSGLDAVIVKLFAIGGEESTMKKIADFKRLRKTPVLPKNEFSVTNLLCYIHAVKGMLMTGSLKNKAAIDQYWKLLGEKGVVFDPEFLMLEIRSGRILSIENAEGLDKLYCENVKADKDYFICSGLRNAYQREELLGNKYLFILNIKKVKFKGLESEGMICCSTNGEGEDRKVEALKVEAGEGEKISLEGHLKLFEELEYGKIDLGKTAYKSILANFQIIDHYMCFKGARVLIEKRNIKAISKEGPVS